MTDSSLQELQKACVRRDSEIRLNGWHLFWGAIFFCLAVVFVAHWLVDWVCDSTGVC